MGQKSCKNISLASEKDYFEQKKLDQIRHFTSVTGFLENSSE